LANVRAVGVNRQRHHGSTGGEQEDERHCCDEGLHGWSPLVFDLPNTVTLGGLAEIKREAIHSP
jgi:hypothetical protein